MKTNCCEATLRKDAAGNPEEIVCGCGAVFPVEIDREGILTSESHDDHIDGWECPGNCPYHGTV